MRWRWPWTRMWARRREAHIDRTGPATAYPARSGAYAVAGEVQARQRVGRHWTTAPTQPYPVVTRGQEHRGGRWRG